MNISKHEKKTGVCALYEIGLDGNSKCTKTGRGCPINGLVEYLEQCRYRADGYGVPRWSYQRCKQCGGPCVQSQLQSANGLCFKCAGV